MRNRLGWPVGGSAAVCFHHDPSHVFLPPHATPGTWTRWSNPGRRPWRRAHVARMQARWWLLPAGVGAAAVCQRGRRSGPAGSSSPVPASTRPPPTHHPPAPPLTFQSRRLPSNRWCGWPLLARWSPGVGAGGGHPPSNTTASPFRVDRPRSTPRSAPLAPCLRPRLPAAVASVAAVAAAGAASRTQPQPTGLLVTAGRAHDTGEDGRGGGPPPP